MTAKNRGLILYASKGCPACAVLKPKIEALVQSHGLRIENRDADACQSKDSGDSVCQRLKYVPTVTYNGREIPLKSLQKKLEKLSKKK